MNFPLFNLFHYEKTQAVKNIIEQATPRNEFFLMNAIAALVATSGLFLDNIPLILGSMLIAPLLSPVFAVALGIVIRDWKLVRNSFVTTSISSLIGIALATITALAMFKTGYGLQNAQYVWTLQPTILLFLVSFLSGVAAATAVTNKQLDSIMPGIAISVSLVPPLAATGIHLANQSWISALYTAVLYFGSLILVCTACIYVFMQMELQTQKNQAKKERKSEKKKEEQRSK